MVLNTKKWMKVKTLGPGLLVRSPCPQEKGHRTSAQPDEMYNFIDKKKGGTPPPLFNYG
jgi:hypothetical protein